MSLLQLKSVKANWLWQKKRTKISFFWLDQFTIYIRQSFLFPIGLNLTIKKKKMSGNSHMEYFSRQTQRNKQILKKNNDICTKTDLIDYFHEINMHRENIQWNYKPIQRDLCNVKVHASKFQNIFWMKS